LSTDPGRRVWDLPLRCTHWLLALAVCGCWISATYSAAAFSWHEYCGYAVLVLVCFRLLWGIVGTRHARFAAFIRGPRELLRYARSVLTASAYRPSVGHNPIGGWVVVAMLLVLLAEAGTGLFANDEIIHTGPFFGWVSGSFSDALTKIHDRTFPVLQAIVGLHILAAALYFLVRHDNLVLPMLTGRKRSDLVPEEEQIRGSRPWLAFGILVALAAALALAIRLAPEASLSLF
jgi:cytochrome b